MIDFAPHPAPATLFDALAPAWVVWFRPGPGVPWSPVGTSDTYSGAVALIGTGGRPNGDWLLSDRPDRPA